MRYTYLREYSYSRLHGCAYTPILDIRLSVWVSGGRSWYAITGLVYASSYGLPFTTRKYLQELRDSFNAQCRPGPSLGAATQLVGGFNLVSVDGYPKHWYHA